MKQSRKANRGTLSPSDRRRARRHPMADVPETMIVKVQRPMFPPDGPWLIYNEDRSRMWEMQPHEVTAEARKAMGDAPKAYFAVEVHGPDVLLLSVVDDQDW